MAELGVRTKGAKTRARIIDSGLELFLAEGTAHVSLRRIASAAGVTPMAIYRHFEDKEALQLALLESAFLQFESYLKSTDGAYQGREGLNALTVRFFDFALEREAQFRFLFLSDGRPQGPAYADKIRAASRPTFIMLRDAIERCFENEALELGDRNIMTIDVLSFVVGQCALHLSGNMVSSAGRRHMALCEAFDRYLQVLLGE